MAQKQASSEKFKKLRAINIPAWMFVFFTLLFYEIIFHFWTMESFVFGRFLCVMLFDLSFALFIAFLSTLGKSALFSRILALVVVTVCMVLYITEYLINDTFKNFMNFASMFGAADDVAGDFSSTISSLIFAEFWRIILFAIPIVVYGVLSFMGNWGRAYGGQIRCYLGFGCVFLFALSFLFMTVASPDSKRYSEEYTFDNAVHDFGLMTAFRMDIGKGKKEVGFEQVTLPPATEQPSEPIGQTQATETTEPPVVYVENKLDIDFDALIEQTSDSDVAAMHEYVSGLTATMQNEYTGLFKGKNLILITAEAFSAEAIDEDLTPTLYRMANKGIKFTDYYQPAWGGSTSTGEYSVITGIVPTNGVESIQDTIGHNMYFTMGNQLQRENYFSAAYHNNTYTYYSRNETHPNLGYSTFTGMGNGMEEGVKKVWPESDEEMIDYTVPLYIDKQPFSVYYMTVSGHCLYTTTGNTMSYRNFDEVTTYHGKPFEGSDTVKGYLAANLELEYAMKSLLKQLEDAGIADDTVVVLSTDHYPYGLEKSTAWGNDQDYLAELYGYEVTDCFTRDHSALIIWSGSIEDMHLQVDTPTYSLDIVPTLSNLFGLKYDSRLLVGRDVFSEAMPLAVWNSYSWKTDKGSYDSSTGDFEPAPGVTIPDGYVDSVSAIVRNKIKFSDVVLNDDYYAALFGKDEIT